MKNVDVDQIFMDLLQGKSEDEAVDRCKRNDYIPRILVKDNVGITVTLEYNSKRINMWIRDGIVIKTNKG